MNFIGKLILGGLITAASAFFAYKVGEHKGKSERYDDDVWDDWDDVDDWGCCDGSCDCDECDDCESSDFNHTDCDIDASCICDHCSCKDICGAGIKATGKTSADTATDSNNGVTDTAADESTDTIADSDNESTDEKADSVTEAGDNVDTTADAPRKSKKSK